jgi:chemotaxis receptor (MCP) glutamine deamidase CheD
VRIGGGENRPAMRARERELPVASRDVRGATGRTATFRNSDN